MISNIGKQFIWGNEMEKEKNYLDKSTADVLCMNTNEPYSADLDMTGHKIVNVGDPVNNNCVVHKKFVKDNYSLTNYARRDELTTLATITELKQFVLKSGNGIKTRRSIPTLEEALMTCKDRILVNIDKGGTYIKEILPIIRKCGMEKQVIIKGRYPVEKVQEEYGTNTSMLYMPIIHLWKEEDIKATESFIKDFTPIAYELCFKDEQTSNLKVIDKIVQSGSRVWMNTLWVSLCGGHDDENALLEGKDKHWGWILEHKATMIQTDRPQELIKYLEDKGLRKL